MKYLATAIGHEWLVVTFPLILELLFGMSFARSSNVVLAYSSKLVIVIRISSIKRVFANVASL